MNNNINKEYLTALHTETINNVNNVSNNAGLTIKEQRRQLLLQKQLAYSNEIININ